MEQSLKELKEEFDYDDEEYGAEEEESEEESESGDDVTNPVEEPVSD